MKHKTWFRLVLKAIGVLLIGYAAPELILRILSFMDYLAAGTLGMWDARDWRRFGYYICPPLLQLAFGLYLLLGGAWLVNKIIPSNRPYCPECGYDLSQSTGDICGECGVTLPRAET